VEKVLISVEIMWLNVLNSCDLSEHSITRTRFNCQTLVYIL